MKNILLSLFLVYTICTNAQVFVNSTNQQLIEDAVKSGLIIIHRQYQLQDVTAATPSFFGWNNDLHFGDSYSLAVKTTEGYYIGGQAVHPWKYDNKFDEYQDNAQYAPVLSGSEYRQLSDTVYSSLPFKEQIIKEISENRIYSVRDTVFGNQGFTTYISATDTIKGWLVWVVSGKPLAENSAQPLFCITYRSELVCKDDQLLYEINPPAIQTNILGGIYVVPEVTAIGQITFKLAGILHFEHEQWHIVRLNQTSAPSPQGGLTPIPSSAEADMTVTPPQETPPASKKKKKK